MRENRQSGSEGGAATSRPYPYHSPGWSVAEPWVFVIKKRAALKERKNLSIPEPIGRLSATVGLLTLWFSLLDSSFDV